jgi:hypothetical protein
MRMIAIDRDILNKTDRQRIAARGISRQSCVWTAAAVLSCAVLMDWTVAANAQNIHLANAQTLISFACAAARVDEAEAHGGIVSPFGTYRDVDFSKITTPDREVAFTSHVQKRFFVLGATFNPPSTIPVVGTVGRATMQSIKNLLGPPKSMENNRFEFAGEDSSIDIVEKEGRVVRVIVSCGSYVW